VVASGFVRDGVSRVVLLTDGLPSIGPQDADKLGELAEAQARKGITVTSMGIGEGFDDELLGEIARRGRGGFYYLATPEAIPAAFGRELAGVFAVAASEVVLKIVPEADVVQCEVRHRVPTRAAPDGLAVELGDIAEGAPRQVLLRMVRRESEGPKLLAKIVVTYGGAATASAPRDSGLDDAPLVDRINAPDSPSPAEVAEIAVEHLRIAVASAVDEAWARRAGGKRAAARAALAEVRSAVAGARERGLASEKELAPLLAELDEAEAGLSGAAHEIERHRRAARERSFVTMVGMSIVQPVPPPPGLPGDDLDPDPSSRARPDDGGDDESS
jgi:Ca-activated chloride channel family protein